MADELGFQTRRFSGDGTGVAGRGLFCLPRLLRACGRQGLHNTVDIDQENAHFLAQLERHPGRPALLRYTREKDGIRDIVAEATKVCRQKAKRLFLQICYGGCVASWCLEHGVAPSDAPSFVFEMAAE